MNTRNTTDIADFTQDLYDLMGRNTGVKCTPGITPKQFFAKWVEDDKAFMVSFEDGRGIIYLDGVTVTVTSNK